MDAVYFEDITEALKQEQASLILQIDAEVSFSKIIWAAWDDVLGPDARFVWNLEKRDEEISSAAIIEALNISFPPSVSREESVVEVHRCGKCGRSRCDGNCEFADEFESIQVFDKYEFFA